MESPLPFHLGSDPEFIQLSLDGRPLSADSLNDLTSYCGNHPAGNIGTDCSLAELRPKPADTVSGHIENIRQLLTSFPKALRALPWSTRCVGGRACGGHIHLELPEEYYNNPTKQTQYQNWMFSFFLPLRLTEDPENVKQRQTTTYGRYFDCRIETKQSQVGRRVTFELRTPTAEWMVSPKIASATLAYLAVIHNEIINHPESLLKHKDILFERHNGTDINSFERLTQSSLDNLIKPLNDRIKRIVKTFELYPKYKKDLSFFFAHKKVLKEKAKYNFDIAEGWGLSLKPETALSDRPTHLPQTADMAYANMSDDLCMFRFNEDVGVASLAHNLSKMLLAMGVKLKHKLILFGLKQHWNEPVVATSNYDVLLGHRQVKTAEQKQSLGKTLRRMIGRFSNPHAYFIGLPKDLRTTPDVEHMLEFLRLLIHKLPEDAKFSPKRSPLNLRAEASKAASGHVIVEETPDPSERCSNCQSTDIGWDEEEEVHFCRDCDFNLD